MPPKPSSGSIILSCFILLQLFDVASADERGLDERLERLRDQANPTVGGVPLASAGLLADFYRQREYGYAWHDSGQILDLLRLAEGSVAEGLKPSDFHHREISEIAYGPALSDLPASARVDADLLMTDSLLRLIHHRRYGKVDPRRLDKRWNHVDGPYASDLMDDLARVFLADNLQIEVEGLVSGPAVYTRLKQGLARYREIAATGGWPTVPAAKTLRPGRSDPRVPILRERLRATGDFDGPSSDSREYDEDLQAAVRTFQERHHLTVDAVVGPATRAAMNIAADKRVDQIRVNLERMRWVSDRLPSDLLLVDIAGQEVRLFRDGAVIWRARAIVGRPSRPTPEFRDQVEYLEINPSWTVPPNILKKDVLPAMRRNPGYLKMKGLQVVNRHGRRVSPGSVNWHASAARFPYMIRQPPGRRNALGQVKFMFPNSYSVYLHDTPTRHLFAKPKRLYSSGCVRVERPWELAELVLNDPERWSQAQLQRAVATRRNRRVDLDEPLPIILAYWTAEAGEDGKVNFREDIYNRDAAVLGALDGRGPIRILFREATKSEPAGSVPPVEQKAGLPSQDLKTISSQ